MKKSRSCIIAALILLLSVGGLSWAAEQKAPPEPKWTLIYYLAADNDQEAYADNTINLLLAGTAETTVQPQILVFFDRLSVPGTEVFEVAGGEIIPLGSFAEQNSADPNVLLDFTRSALNLSLRDNIAFIVKSEGFAWRGIGRDNTHDEEIDDQLMTNGGLAEALTTAQDESGRDIDLLVLEGSMMSFMEAVYDLRDAAPFLVASQSKVLLDGLPWDMVIQDLIVNPTMSASTLGITIVDDYIHSYADNGNSGDPSAGTSTDFASLTLFDLTGVDEARDAQNAWDETAWSLLDEVYTYMAHARDLSAVGGLSHVTTADYQHDIRTLMTECLRLLEEAGLSYPELNAATDSYLDAHDHLVVYESSSDNGDQLGATTGLGIWYPPTWLQYDTSDEDETVFGSTMAYEDPAIGLDWLADSNWLTYLFEYFNRADAYLGEDDTEDDPPKPGVYDQM